MKLVEQLNGENRRMTGEFGASLCFVLSVVPRSSMTKTQNYGENGRMTGEFGAFNYRA